MSQLHTGKTILCVDDQESLHFLYKHVLGEAGYRVLVANNPRKGIELANSGIDLLVSDGNLKNTMDGPEMVRVLRQEHHFTKPVLFATSGYLSVKDMENITKTLNPHCFIEKPINLNHLIYIVGMALSEKPVFTHSVIEIERTDIKRDFSYQPQQVYAMPR